MRLKALCTLLLVAGTAGVGAGANPSDPQFTLASWTSRDGLPSSYVMSLVQDSRGLLWVGTTAGLSLFDGQRFIPWPRQGTFPSPNPIVYALAPARDGSVWVAFGGPSRVAHDRSGTITVFTERDGLPHGSMRTVVVDGQGVAWAGGTGGLVRFTGSRWTRVETGLGEPDPGVTEMTVDREDRIWFVTPRGVFRISPDRRRVEPVKTGLTGTITLRSVPTGMLMSAAGRIILVDAVTGLATSQTAAPGLTTSPFLVATDRRGRLWAGSNGEGLVMLDGPAGGRAPRHFTEREGLAGDLIRKLLEDHDGNLWVGTQAGLTRITEATISTMRIRTGVSAENVTRVAATGDGAVWVQSPDGLVQLTGRQRVVHASMQGVSLRTISALHTDREGTLWVGTTDGHLLSRRAGTFRLATWPPSEAPSAILGITTDSRGRVWIEDDAGRLLLRNGAQVTSLPVPPTLRSTPLRFLNTDSRDRLWLGTDGVIGVFDGRTFTLYTEAEGLPPGQLAGFHEDGRRRIWLATDNGLSTLEGGRFVTVGAASGLPRSRIFSVVEDRTGVFWLGIGAGVLRVEAGELEAAILDREHRIRYRLFEESDGLQGTPVLRGQPTAVRAADGVLWFITSNGLATIDPIRLSTAPKPPPARIEAFVADGTRLDAAGTLQLAPGLSTLHIEYAALNLTSPSKLQFRHQLIGLDANWVDNGTNRQASYANLSPGAYTFRVAASNGDGAWSTAPGTISLTVLPIWYQTRTAYVFAIVAAAMVLWTSWRARARQLQQRFAVVLAERARVGREIHDTLLQSLVGMALQLDTLADQADASPPGTMRHDLSRLRRQVEHYIGEAQESIWDLRSPLHGPGDLPSSLRERAERATGGADVRFEFAVQGIPRPLPIRVHQQVLRIAQEAVVNAVRHAHPRSIRMDLLYDADAVHLSVVDDGHGFNSEVPHGSTDSHWGLSIMRERAEQIGARFSVSSGPERGTRIDLVAPLMGTS